jgi:hypothetical protein
MGQESSLAWLGSVARQLYESGIGGTVALLLVRVRLGNAAYYGKC